MTAVMESIFAPMRGMRVRIISIGAVFTRNPNDKQRSDDRNFEMIYLQEGNA